MKIINKCVAKDGTIKYAIECNSGDRLEACVLFFDCNGLSEINICISCQIGCRMSCDFCIAGHKHFIRSLYKTEIIEELNLIIEDIKQVIDNKRIEITYMGSGEPFDNFNAVLTSIQTIRVLYENIVRINISTMLPFTDVDLKQFIGLSGYVHIQYSLHSTNDVVRKMLFRRNLPLIVDSLRCISEVSDMLQDRFCVNYVLFSGINDSQKDADNLCQLVKNYNCYVKVSEFAEIDESSLYKSKLQQSFCDRLNSNGVEAKLFVSHGIDVNAACGNFYRNYML